MKSCPYCAEQIQEEATKCKHCGEWLNKTTANDVFNNARNLISQKINEYSEFKNKHLFLPQNDKPIELKNTKIFPEYLIYKDKVFYYNEIYALTKRYYEQYINGVPTEKTFSCLLYLNSTKFTNDKGVIDLTVSSELFSLSFNKKKRETTILACNWIEKLTFKNRLNVSLKELSEKGYFSYNNKIRIYNNGDLFIGEENKVNIYEAYKNEAVWYGIKYKSLFGANRGQDPYLFKIQNINKGLNLGFMTLGGKVEFDTSYNKDVFDFLITELFDKGKIID